MADIIPPSAPSGTQPLPNDPDHLRRTARDAYARGLLNGAAEAQAAVLETTRPAAEDFLFAGLIYHAARRMDEGVRVMQDGARLYPAIASMHENLAVLLLATGDLPGSIAASEAALALGSDSPNVYDCLCDAYNRSGQTDRAREAGRHALQAKDHRFGNATPIVAMPTNPPPAFDPNRPDRNIIAYSLWGNQPRYHLPLLENARIRPHLFPHWTIRVYHDPSVDPAYLAKLARLGAQLHPMALPPDVPARRALLWRFEVIADPAVSRFLIRDADSLLTVKERVAVDAWIGSNLHFHAMRDWFSHTDLLLAGMWGGIANILPPPATLLRAYTAWRVENDHLDQDVLTETVWPAIRRNVLIHDSIFQPCLGSVPFPPFGTLPSGHHIGQNAFVHFSKTS